MTISAESFTGRVLAVLSRRSPGFRPALKSLGPDPALEAPRPGLASPADPTHDSMTVLSLADATSRWKSVSPHERLRYRRNLLKVADLLKDVDLDPDVDPALDFDHDRASARDGVRSRASDLVRDVGLVRDTSREIVRARARDLAIYPACDRAGRPFRYPVGVRVRAFVRDLDRAGDFSRAFRRAKTLALTLDHDVDFDRALDLALALVRGLKVSDRVNARARGVPANLTLDRQLANAHGLSRVLVRDLIRAFVRDPDLVRALASTLDPTSALTRALGLAPGLDLANGLIYDVTRARVQARFRASDLMEARSNLTDAAINFLGADLTTVDFAAINLVGIRWDRNTRWPTPEWAARMRRTSVEDPPGSGVFIVRPEEGRRFADRGSLTPLTPIS
ncbi:hypothetical protein HLK59_17770 [Streptomyces sp. S3(2020)]|uniref:hypothetical protein n=1 Tax=Streptomyces sp. S3(2020) TaxID=2732044 RepID=UPI001487E526|nr:hypothetical protein [Streptomyces sp. S3(2020)]NNN32176.1 hypothetical protein [Streptomyces sp. S3(2020)]